LGICLLYYKRYLFSVVVISLLPAIRQDGFLYLALWTFFLIKDKKIKYLPILVAPLASWALVNYFFVVRSFLYTFFYQLYLVVTKINRSPPQQTVGTVFSPTSLISLLYQPLFLASFINLFIFFKKERQYRRISICFLSHIFFLFL
jgi:hypothetical protein